MAFKKVNIYTALLLRFGIALFLFSLCRVIFILFNYSFYPDLSFGVLVKIFYGGIFFDIAGLLYLLGLYILLQIIPFKFRNLNIYQKITNWFFIIPLSLGIIVNLMDTIYYKFTLKRTTIAMFDQFSNETNMGKLFLQFTLDYWYMILIAAALIFITYFLTKKVTVTAVSQQKNSYYFLTSLFFSAAIIAFSIIGVRGGYRHSTRPITLSNASKYITKPNQRAIVLNTPFTLLRTYDEVALEDVKYFSQSKQETIFSAHLTNISDSLFKKKNVVLIILESFGREHFGALNKDIPNYKGFTPFLDSLINYSYSFKKSFANGRKSISGMPSTITSIPSLKTPFILSNYSGNKINSLASLLKTENYSSAFFHGAPNGSMGFDAFSQQAGFDAYFGMTEYGNDNDFDGFWGIWDEEFFQFYANKMNNMKEPFFTSIFSVSSHHPYKVPEKYKNHFPTGKLEIQETIGYTDYALKKFFKTARKMPWFKNTIFVLTADHASTFSDLSQYKTLPGYFAVPLIIYDPSNTQLRKLNDSTVVQQIDIMPTVLNLLNYPNDYIAFGNDIFNKEVPHIAINYLADYFHLYKNDLVVQFDGKTVIGVFNFKKDPLFHVNLISENTTEQKELINLCKAFIQEHNRRMIHNDLSIISNNK